MNVATEVTPTAISHGLLTWLVGATSVATYFL